MVFVNTMSGLDNITLKNEVLFSSTCRGIQCNGGFRINKSGSNKDSSSNINSNKNGSSNSIVIVIVALQVVVILLVILSPLVVDS